VEKQLKKYRKHPFIKIGESPTWCIVL
jgi:hypothetical protein